MRGGDVTASLWSGGRLNQQPGSRSGLGDRGDAPGVGGLATSRLRLRPRVPANEDPIETITDEDSGTPVDRQLQAHLRSAEKRRRPPVRMAAHPP